MNAWLYLTLLLTVSVWTLRRGGAPERIATSAILFAVAATIAVASNRIFGSREIGIFVVDMVLTLVICTLAMLAERFWPVWLSAILIVGVMLQLAIWYAPHYYRDVYLILHAMSAYPTLLLILAGTLRHRHRLRRDGHDPAWSRTARRKTPDAPAA
ncbi:hypothetical protein ASE70_16610 [Sphingomonas sp. Leaf22]|uniref:hypothetical protein n=1 Tax=Sphingomonas sp. Leaf22 TaxID=1735687 RepID=UPI0006FDA978|nr:hypothetical protein [Sphingomonas sp. Leaf22]KQM89191.1 hypothetical protein ASE70_16610 [Sphingomonas sp. Leaf22]